MTLAELVKLWRATLAPEVALAAKHAAATVPQETWPATPKPLQVMWLERASGKVTAEDIAELMRVSDFARATAKQLLARLEIMGTWKPDPNMTRWLVDVFARPTRQPTLDGQKCFRRVFNLLIDHLDLEGATQLRGFIGTTAERLGTTAWGTTFLEEGFARVLAKSEQRLAGARPLTAAERASLEASGLLQAPTRTRSTLTLDALLEAVYATPEDDAPRAVLADFLQEQGDPRGELIALDLLPTPTKEQHVRRRQLLVEHGKRWFPPALDKIIKRDAEYQRGFLARGTLVTTAHVPRELATFRELELGTTAGAPDLESEVFGGVAGWRGFRQASSDHCKLLRSCRPQPRARRVGLRAHFGDPLDTLAELLRPEAWPAVTEIAVDVIDPYDIRHWSDESVPRWIDDFVKVFASRFPGVRRFTVDEIATFDRDGRTQEIYLPSKLAFQLLPRFPDPTPAPSRQRWFDWLIEKAVPVVVPRENPNHAPGDAYPPKLRAVAPGLEVRVGTSSSWQPLD